MGSGDFSSPRSWDSWEAALSFMSPHFPELCKFLCLLNRYLPCITGMISTDSMEREIATVVITKTGTGMIGITRKLVTSKCFVGLVGGQ